MKRFLSLLLAAVLIIFSGLTASAAERYVKPELEIRRWNGTRYVKMSPGETASVGDVLGVYVSFNQNVDSLSTLRLKVEYPSENVSYIKSSFSPTLVANDRNAGEPILNDNNGVLSVFFAKDDVSSKYSGEFLSGTPAKEIATFQFVCEKPTDSAKFKAIIDNAIASDDKEVALSEKYDNFTIKISEWALSDSDKKAFEKLETIVYSPPEGSLPDLNNADEIYEKFSAADKVRFQAFYPELFEYYSTGWTRYYDAGIAATEAQLAAEVERFRETYKDVLALENADAVTTQNYVAVQAAVSAWNKLDKEAPQVTLRLLKEKEKLDILGAKADSIEDSIAADKDAKEWFIERYETKLWNITEDMVTEDTYSEYMVVIAEALADYESIEHDALSASMKAEVESKYQYLLSIQDWVAATAEKVGEDAKIQKEIEDFTSKWLAVTRLNAMTAGTGDKRALEMYLEDFDNLSKTAQTRLASRKKTATDLLEYVNELIKLEGNGVIVPGGGTTVETVEKIIEKLIEVPGETITKTETVTETETKIQQFLRQIPLIVYIMIILAGASILVAAIPVGAYIIKRKKSDK